MNGTDADDALVDRIQHVAFEYFLEQVTADNGLIADSSRAGSPSSIAAVGLALASYPVGVERGWMAREEAAARTRTTLQFFRDAPNDGGPTATGHMGFFYHFLDRETGRRAWRSEVSLVDTGFLAAGMLTAQAYFSGPSPVESDIRSLADELYRRMDWRWACDGGLALSHGWKPESGFLHYGWQGYSEAALLYVLALGSPTHALDRDSYLAWNTTYQWESLYDRDVLYAGPLFIHQYSHAWLDFRGIRDRFMRGKRSDYFENTRRAIQIQREYCRRNPLEHPGYGEDAWGLSACEGPGDYVARGAPFGPDDGVLSPASVIASLPFEPELTRAAMRHWMDRFPDVFAGGRIPSGFSPGRPWTSTDRIGLDQGFAVLLIENYRSERIWELMRRCPYVERGLRRGGFTGGWLTRARRRRT